MKISLKNLILCAVAALGLSAAGTASAVSILNFAGTATLEPPALGDAESIIRFFGVDDEGNVVNDTLRTQNASGIFASIEPGTLINSFGPVDFAAGAGIDPLFSLGDYELDLDSSSLVFQNTNFLNVSGTGTISGPGGFSVPATVLFSTQAGDVADRFSISGSVIVPDQNVPEGGSAVVLLGLGLIGVESLRRRLAKA